MDRDGSLITLIVLIFIGLIELTKSRKPNIILIVADDLGWADVGFHGSPQILTRDIDALASDGIVFNNYYVSPICSPSRSALMTGYHPVQMGLQHSVIGASEPFGVPLDIKLIPNYLKELGYATHAIGKWHLGNYNWNSTPTYRGFDTFFGLYNGHQDYFSHVCESGRFSGYDLHRNEKPVGKEYDGQYLTTILSEESVKVIISRDPTPGSLRNERKTEKNQNKPFFMYLAFQAIHAGNSRTPLDAALDQDIKIFKDTVKNPKRRVIAAMTYALNRAVRQVVVALNETGELQNTIIIFTSDNGGATGPENGWHIDQSHGSNWPLRGTKYTLFEGGIKSIGFVWSGLNEKGTPYNYDCLMHISDLAPTILEAAGYEMSKVPKDIYGESMWKTLIKGYYLKKYKCPRTRLLHNYDPRYNFASFRSGNYKLMQNTIFGNKVDGWYRPSGMFSDDESLTSSKFSLYKYSITQSILNSFGRGNNPNSKLPIMINCTRKSNDIPCNLARDSSANRYCLFDIDQDPCELNNLMTGGPKAKSMIKEMLSLNFKIAKEPINKGRRPECRPDST